MASRHRRRKRVELNQRMSAYGNEALSYAEVPFSPELSRPGLDPEVIRALQATDELVVEMRRGLHWPSQVFDEDSAVERYLVYVSVLIDSVLSDITMSAFMKNDLMVHSKMRILAEYVVKAAYYNDHPDYALYMMTIGDAKSALHKLKDAKSDPTIIASALGFVDDLERRFARVAHLQRLDFSELMTKYAERADYVWLYRAPSAVLHGDPDGMRMILEPTTDGREKIMIEFDVNYVNAVLVDAGSNAVFFCSHFIDRFSPKNTDLQSTISALNERFQRLMIRHRYGRNDTVLNEMQKELDR